MARIFHHGDGEAAGGTESRRIVEQQMYFHEWHRRLACEHRPEAGATIFLMREAECETVVQPIHDLNSHLCVSVVKTFMNHAG